MIARKITYRGNFDQASIGAIYDVARKSEITGRIKPISPQEIELSLEGDAAVIKLILHQIERRVEVAFTDKSVVQIPFQNYVGITLLN